MRRLRDLWRRLQVRDDDQETLVVLNQASRKREVQPDLARKVVGGRLAETTIPADFAAFEAAVNTGSPARLEDQKLRGAFEALATEIDALPAVDDPAEGDGEPRGLLARLSGERGQSTVEFAGILPLLLIVVILLWQIGLTGYTFMLAGHSAREGSRELAIDTTDTKKDRPYADVALDDLPEAWRKHAKVDRPEDNTVRVRLKVPLLFPSREGPLDRHLGGGHGHRGRAAAGLAEGRPAMRRFVAALRDEAGQASVEFAGVLMWMLLAALLIWQLLLVTWTFTSASNAARTATRVEGRGRQRREGRQGGAHAQPAQAREGRRDGGEGDGAGADPDRAARPGLREAARHPHRGAPGVTV